MECPLVLRVDWELAVWSCYTTRLPYAGFEIQEADFV